MPDRKTSIGFAAVCALIAFMWSLAGAIILSDLSLYVYAALFAGFAFWFARERARIGGGND